MKVEINKREVEVAPHITNLESLLQAESLLRPGTAVAVNNKVVAKALLSSFALADGMKITVIKAVCGG